MTRLWEIGAELDTIGTHIIEAHGEISDGLQKMLDDTEMKFSEKSTRVALMIRMMEADGATARSEAQRMTKRAKAYENAAKGLRNYLKHHMLARDYPFIKSPRATVTVVSNSQPTVALALGVTLDDIDPEYLKTSEPVTTLDKAAVVRAFDASAANRKEKTAPEGTVVEYGDHVQIT